MSSVPDDRPGNDIQDADHDHTSTITVNDAENLIKTNIPRHLGSYVTMSTKLSVMSQVQPAASLFLILTG